MERVAIVVPAYNEQKTLVDKVLQIEEFRNRNVPYCDIIVSDNNSTDATPDLAKKLCSGHKKILYHFVQQKGKGAAIKNTWLAFDYDIYSFMDVDLSTDLNSFPEMIEAIRNGYDIAIGSRYSQGSRTERSFKRELISKSYRLLFHSLFKTDITDPQCGFKAINKEVRDNVLPYVENTGFFFDTELLLRAYYTGYKIKEVPVSWTEDPDTTVDFVRDIPKFLKGMIRLKYQLLAERRKNEK